MFSWVLNAALEYWIIRVLANFQESSEGQFPRKSLNVFEFKSISFYTENNLHHLQKYRTLKI